MKRMKSNLKVTVSLLMAAGLACLAGCGGKGDGSSAVITDSGAGVEDLGIYYSVEEESFSESAGFTAA